MYIYSDSIHMTDMENMENTAEVEPTAEVENTTEVEPTAEVENTTEVEPTAEVENTEGRNRRRHERSEFAYPTSIKIFSQYTAGIVYNGYVDNISTSGACIVIEDRYGRINPDSIRNAKVKISIRIAKSEYISLLAEIRWIKRNNSKRLVVQMGIEFDNVEDWQLEIINKIVTMKNKDQTMMWHLWEQYEKKLYESPQECNN